MKLSPIHIVCFIYSLTSSLTALGDSDYELDKEERSGFVFDLRVANMPYKSERMTGQTSSHGEFVFLDGETITFSIGNFNFKPVKANEYLSIFKFIDNDNLIQSVSNLTRLLQAIDIKPDQTTIVLPNISTIDLSGLDFDQSPINFSKDPIIVNLLGALGLDTDLLSNPHVNNHVYSMVTLLQPYN